MERLILEYTEGDGCTYSCTNTLPIICESKEKAISGMETILLQHQIALEERNKKIQQSEKELDKARQNVTKLTDKKNKEKELAKAVQEFSDVLTKNREIFNSVSNEFSFGGQTLYYDHFFERDSNGEQHIYPPNIYTLDEFFAQIETN